MLIYVLPCPVMKRPQQIVLLLMALSVAALCPASLSARESSASDASWTLRPEHLYTGLLRPLMIELGSPGAERVASVLAAELELIDPTRNDVVGRVPISPRAQRLDLTELFPVIWTARAPGVLYCQLHIDNEPAGTPLVIEPLLAVQEAPADELTALLLRAYEDNDRVEIERLLALSPAERAGLRALPPDAGDAPPLLTGVRVYPLVRVSFETTHGPLVVEPRPDAAPRTAHRFIELASDGYYNDVAFHRIIRRDARGRRAFVQTGDPTGTGLGAPGEFFDFEPSALRHGYGVVSMARDPQRPNTNGGQFFVVLGDAVGPDFDGLYSAFGVVIEGAETLEAISRVPVGRADPDDPASPRERPLELVAILSTEIVPAPAYDTERGETAPISPDDRAPVVR